MLQINKQLTRLDFGPLAAGSIITFEPKFNKDNLSVIYSLKQFSSLDAYNDFKDPEKPSPTLVPGVSDFDYKLQKICTPAEYEQLNEAGAADLVEIWLKELLEGNGVGAGNIEILS